MTLSKEDHFTLVESGSVAVNRWQKLHPTEHLELSGFTFSRIDIPSTDLSQADLEGATFDSCDLSNSDLSSARLKSVSFVNCKLVGVNFNGADLRKANFDKVDLGDAEFGSNPTISRIGRLTLQPNVSGLPKYNKSEVPFWDSLLSWEKLRFMKGINIFIPSYVALIMSLMYLNGISAYNFFVAKMNEMVAQNPEMFETEPLEFAEAGTRQIWVLTTFLTLAAASTIFLACPSRITDFSREQWENDVKRPLLLYDHSSWSRRWVRISCTTLFVAGGIIAAILLISAISRQISFIVLNAFEGGG